MAERIFSKARISLAPNHVQVVKDLKVGSRVRIVLFGTVNEIVERAEEESLDDHAVLGEIDMTVATVKAVSSSEIADLFEEEISG